MSVSCNNNDHDIRAIHWIHTSLERKPDLKIVYHQCHIFHGLFVPASKRWRSRHIVMLHLIFSNWRVNNHRELKCRMKTDTETLPRQGIHLTVFSLWLVTDGAASVKRVDCLTILKALSGSSVVGMCVLCVRIVRFCGHSDRETA